MKINSNSWNRIRYTLYAPVYDLFISRIFHTSRQASIKILNIQPNDKVLLVGAGTGLDLPYLPPQTQVYAGDITPAMVQEIKKKAETLNLNAQVEVMDGQKLIFPDNYFDKVILHLIVAVIPDPVACLREAERVLKPEGEAVIFDKFLSVTGKVSPFRSVLNMFTSFLFSDITRKAEVLLAKTNFKLLNNLPANFNGNFRILKIRKPA